MTRADYQGDHHRAPRLERAELRLLWHDDFYDGPLSGLLLYQGRKLRFEQAEDLPRARAFWVLELSEAQLAEEERWHALFEEHVGTHTNFPEEGQPARRPGEGVKPRSGWDAFYAPYQARTPLDTSGAPVVGWFLWP